MKLVELQLEKDIYATQNKNGLKLGTVLFLKENVKTVGN